jgi:ABC-type phosphate transport system substrate-binding protein
MVADYFPIVTAFAALLEWILSPQGQCLAEMTGYVPILAG